MIKLIEWFGYSSIWHSDTKQERRIDKPDRMSSTKKYFYIIFKSTILKENILVSVNASINKPKDVIS